MDERIDTLSTLTISIRLAHVMAAIAILYRQARITALSESGLKSYKSCEPKEKEEKEEVEFPTAIAPASWPSLAQDLASTVFNTFTKLTSSRNEQVHSLTDSSLRAAVEEGPSEGVVGGEVILFLQASWSVLFGLRYGQQERSNKCLDEEMRALAKYDRAYGRRKATDTATTAKVTNAAAAANAANDTSTATTISAGKKKQKSKDQVD